MRSSTSNSEFPHHRAPLKNWFLIWGMSLLMTSLAVSVAECYWRSQGHRASVTDSLAHWSSQRSRVSDSSTQHVVLLGASRIQLGFSLDEFQQRFPDYEVTQLAIDGRFPIATLVDLAGDRSFRGIVLCSITAEGFQRSEWSDQQEYVDDFHHQYRLPIAIEDYCGTSLQNSLVILNPRIRLDSVVHCLLAGDPLPKPFYVVTHANRSREADYGMIDIEKHRAQRVRKIHEWSKAKSPTAQEWGRDVKDIEQYVKAIQARGGKVVFIRFPTSDEHWELDESRYPRKNFWDQLSDLTSAVTIHFQDVPGLADFELPDTSHLDFRDAPKFTRILLQELHSRHVLRN